MKLKKRTGIYEASNVYFDPKHVVAKSYGWWTFVAVIGGKTVFNAHPYSNTTIGHQYKMRSLLRELGVTIDMTVNTRESLSKFETLKTLQEAVEAQRLKDAVVAEAKRVSRLEKAKLRRFQKRMNAEGLYSEAQWRAIKGGASLESYSFNRASKI